MNRLIINNYVEELNYNLLLYYLKHLDLERIINEMNKNNLKEWLIIFDKTNISFLIKRNSDNSISIFIEYVCNNTIQRKKC